MGNNNKEKLLKENKLREMHQNCLFCNQTEIYKTKKIEARAFCLNTATRRRIVNQQRTGVISCFPLRNILKIRSERLWTEEFDVQRGLYVN